MRIARWAFPSDEWYWDGIDYYYTNGRGRTNPTTGKWEWALPGPETVNNNDDSIAWMYTRTNTYEGVSQMSWFPWNLTLYNDQWEEITGDIHIVQEWVTFSGPLTRDYAGYPLVRFSEPLTGWMVWTI
jgi:hypothetical protein